MIQYDDEFEENFFFISNRTLRKNMGDALRGAVELSAVAKRYSPLIRSIFYKTSIIYLASIIEASLHFCLIKTLGKTYEKPDWIYRNIKVLYKAREGSDSLCMEIIAGERIKKRVNTKGYIDFKVLNKICYEGGIISERVYRETEKVRELRNKIHLFRLSEIDRKYSKKDVNSVSKIVDSILNIIERKLKFNK